MVWPVATAEHQPAPTSLTGYATESFKRRGALPPAAFGFSTAPPLARQTLPSLNRFDDVRRDLCRPQDATDVGLVDLFSGGAISAMVACVPFFSCSRHPNARATAMALERHPASEIVSW